MKKATALLLGLVLVVALLVTPAPVQRKHSNHTYDPWTGGLIGWIVGYLIDGMRNQGSPSNGGFQGQDDSPDQNGQSGNGSAGGGGGSGF